MEEDLNTLRTKLAACKAANEALTVELETAHHRIIELENKRATQITCSKVLLVEGNDEINFFHALITHLGLKDIQIREYTGISSLPKKLAAFLIDPGIDQVTAYAIIRDADTSARSTFNSVKSILEQNKEPCPRKHATFTRTTPRKVGVFLMPGNNATKGMLEDLCLQTVAGHEVMPCVEDFMICLDKRTVRHKPPESRDKTKAYHPLNESKARVQAFLAAMYESVPSLGVAAQKRYWHFDDPVLNELRTFLAELAQ